MRKLSLLLTLLISFSATSEETISRWMADYFERIHKHIANENYEKAQAELVLGDTNYFRNGRT